MTNSLEIAQKAKSFVSSLPNEVIGQPQNKFVIGDFSDDMLPFELYKGGRKNIERVADQINQSFYYGIYDGCFVLMRRLIEMLLILSYKEFKIESEIRGNDGKYMNLARIIDKAVASTKLDLTQFAKDNLDVYRENGGLSAHGTFYNAVEKDLQLVQQKFRAVVQELFFKAGILK